MKKRIIMLLLVMIMGLLPACGKDDAVMSEDEIQDMYQEVGIQSIDEMEDGVSVAFVREVSGMMGEESDYGIYYKQIVGEDADESQVYYRCLYGLGDDEAAAEDMVERYCEYLLSEGYELTELGVLKEHKVYAKENVAIVEIGIVGDLRNEHGEITGEGKSFPLVIVPIN
ncbi:MAG: hypothetical protein IKW30_07915 [Lachnospiraceae bacterium]|nr:hypothetical protein [Lachnospiraceae bacterium]